MTTMILGSTAGLLQLLLLVVFRGLTASALSTASLLEGCPAIVNKLQLIYNHIINTIQQKQQNIPGTMVNIINNK